MNLILCDDDKVFLNKLEIRIRGLCQKHKIAVKMECYVSAAYSARTAHPFQRNGAPFRFKLSKAQQVD